MKLHCLFVQRKCGYRGEYGPELYAAIDEYIADENPEYMREELAQVRDDDSIESFAVIDVRVQTLEIEKILGRQEIKGDIE